MAAHSAALRCLKKSVKTMKPCVVQAICTDAHFWVPVVVLALGIALLVYLH
jgi:hypothetical protein